MDARDASVPWDLFSGRGFSRCRMVLNGHHARRYLTVEVYILEVEELEAKIAPGRGISLGGQ